MPPSSAISRTMSPADWKFRHEADALSHRMPFGEQHFGDMAADGTNSASRAGHQDRASM